MSLGSAKECPGPAATGSAREWDQRLQGRRTRVRVGREGRKKRAREPGETVREKTLVRP
jgi:hypothetical protein